MMKNLSIIVLFAVAFVFASCGDEKKAPQAQQAHTETQKPAHSPKPTKKEQPSIHLQGKDKSEIDKLQSFLENGELIFDFEYGDLNKDDNKKDVVLIGYLPKKEEAATAGDPVKRTTYILTRGTDGKLKKEASNSDATMCSTCGGQMGDPYQGITIKNGFFSLEHAGGSRDRWMTINTFKYDAAKKNWFLNSIGTELIDTSNPTQSTTSKKTSKDFGEVKFADFKEEE